eukprot:728322-Prorocentrum_minimum.AAC.2
MSGLDRRDVEIFRDLPRSACRAQLTRRGGSDLFRMCPVAMVLNRPYQGTYDLEPFLRDFFSDPKYTKYTVAMAYMDTRGAKLLQLALERGADMDMVMPLNPNVYQDSNRKALCGYSPQSHRRTVHHSPHVAEMSKCVSGQPLDEST